MNLSADLGAKVALVTGASSGIGRGVAIALAKAGCRVFINYPPREGSEAASAVLADIQAGGGTATLAPADVSNEDDVSNMFNALMADAGRLDILVNNAGIARSAPVEDITLADWQAVMGVHVTGTFLCTRAALPVMYQQNSGRIINTASPLA